MTYVSNLFNEVSNKVEKLYQVEVVDFDGIATIVEVLATSAAEAQAEAAEIVGEADYTSVVYVEEV